MTYPNTAGYQSHSDTSKKAAELLDANAIQTLYDKIMECAKSVNGITIDEVAAFCKIQTGTASARVRELELNHKLVKTIFKRKTRSGRNAVVYKTKYNVNDFEIAQIKPETIDYKQAAVELAMALDNLLNDPAKNLDNARAIRQKWKNKV